MCVTSVIFDSTKDMWNPKPNYTYPTWPTFNPAAPTQPPEIWTPPYTGPTKEQFQELIELLKAAKKFDTATGQKDCENKMKMEMLKKMAAAIGIDLPADL